MRSSRLLICLAILFPLSASAQPPKELSVTVYNENLALIRDVRSVQFKKGDQWIRFTNVTAEIDPASVHFHSLSDRNSLFILEQNFEYDLVNSQKVLQKFVGREIELFASSSDTLRGTLLDASHEDVVLQKPDGTIRIVRAREIRSFAFPRLPEGLIVEPTLLWLVHSEKTGSQEIETEYLTGGLSWKAQYVAVLAENEKALDLTAWVSVTNRSGMTFTDANLKLVAGDVRYRPTPSAEKSDFQMTMAMRARAGIEEKGFFEYHLYTVPRKTTLRNNEVKQINLFEASTVPVSKKYFVESVSEKPPVQVQLRFHNTKNNGLGLPFPWGVFRVYKRDMDGAMIFVGEDMIDHTPRDEWLEVVIGTAFDIKAERRKISSKRLEENVYQETIEVRLRNRKTERIVVNVREYFYPRRPQEEWEIVQSTTEYEREDANTAVFPVSIPAGQEFILRFTVMYR